MGIIYWMIELQVVIIEIKLLSQIPSNCYGFRNQGKPKRVKSLEDGFPYRRLEGMNSFSFG